MDKGCILPSSSYNGKCFTDKIVEKIKTRISRSVTFFFPPENRVVYEIMWKNIVELDRCIVCLLIRMVFLLPFQSQLGFLHMFGMSKKLALPEVIV
jgi:hypothetical protein